MNFELAVKLSGIPVETQMKLRIYTFLPREGTKQALEEVRYFVSHDCPKHPFLTLTGPAGLGKTHLAIGIGWHWLENYTKQQVRYWQVQDLLSTLQRGYSAVDPAQKHELTSCLYEATHVPLTILDDLGAEHLTEWSDSIIDSLIDYRYINKLRTVITTNASKESLPPRVASRLKEGTRCVLSGRDYREIIGAAVNRIKDESYGKSH